MTVVRSSRPPTNTPSGPSTGSSVINAGDLEPGDTVTGPNGELQHLLTTQYEHHPDGIPVFNFEVTDYHTYYVAENGARATPLLVHNAEGYAPDRRAILREAEQLDELSRLNARSSITLDHYQDEMIDLIELTDRLDRNSLLLPEVEEQLRRANAAQEAFEASMDAYDEAYFSSGHLLN